MKRNLNLITLTALLLAASSLIAETSTAPTAAQDQRPLPLPLRATRRPLNVAFILTDVIVTTTP